MDFVSLFSGIGGIDLGLEVIQMDIRIPEKQSLLKGRVLVWFSCGAASACAAKIISEKYPNAEYLYCDTKSEHPDNHRFMDDVAEWIGKEIKILSSDKYDDIYDVFLKTKWINGPSGARCTVELKRNVREVYQMPGDVHVFGMGFDELDRVKRFEINNPELYLMWPLVEYNMTKQDCLDMLSEAGIELPMMYRLGYRNNNCIGCVKGGKGYWNKIRNDFPRHFQYMSEIERKVGASCIKGIFLDELDPKAGRYESEFDIECGPVCNR